MYQAASDKLKRKIEWFNTNSNWFVFSQSDLEPTYNDISGKKYNITSSQLQKK